MKPRESNKLKSLVIVAGLIVTVGAEAVLLVLITIIKSTARTERVLPFLTRSHLRPI